MISSRGQLRRCIRVYTIQLITTLYYTFLFGSESSLFKLTRRMVLGAVLDLVADGTLDEVSVPAVARRSGVSVATIYRYFPSKDDLLTAAAAEPSRRALASTERPATQPGDDEFATFLRTMWHEFSGNLPLLRHQISSDAGREMRRARLDDGRDRLAAYVEAFGVDPGSVEGQR